jgi:hypothetical protein
MDARPRAIFLAPHLLDRRPSSPRRRRRRQPLRGGPKPPFIRLLFSEFVLQDPTAPMSVNQNPTARFIHLLTKPKSAPNRREPGVAGALNRTAAAAELNCTRWNDEEIMEYL